MKTRRNTGFTLIEFVVVIIIISTLGAVLLDRMWFYQEAAEKAAMLSRFEQANADGKPVRLKGTLLYRFKKARDVTVSLRAMKAVEPTARGATAKPAAGPGP